jgi:hypothetical protein
VTDVVSDLGGVRAQVVGPAPGEVRPGSPLYARHAPVAGCPTGETWSLAPVGLEHRAALPPGEWTLSTTPDGSGAPPTGWPTVVVTPGSVPPDVTPVSVP